MNSIFKVVAILFGILFLVSAGLQYNDPDSVLWIVIWGFAGIIAFAFAFRKVSFPLPMISGIAALIGFFYLYPEKFEGFEIGAGDIKNIEEGGNVSVRVLIKLLRYYDKKIVIGASGTMVKNADFGELKSYL